MPNKHNILTKTQQEHFLRYGEINLKQKEVQLVEITDAEIRSIIPCERPQGLVRWGTYVGITKCKKCIQCQIQKMRRLEGAMLYESIKYGAGNSWFVTLTHDHESIPRNSIGIPTLDKDYAKKFIKRLRYYYDQFHKDIFKWRPHHEKPRMKMLFCGEYGGRNKRPHYHMQIHGLSDDIIHRAWHDVENKKSPGIIHTLPIKPGATQYILKDMVKQMTNEGESFESDLHFGQETKYDHVTGLYYNLQPPFIIKSQGLFNFQDYVKQNPQRIQQMRDCHDTYQAGFNEFVFSSTTGTHIYPVPDTLANLVWNTPQRKRQRGEAIYKSLQKRIEDEKHEMRMSGDKRTFIQKMESRKSIRARRATSSNFGKFKI